MTRRARTVFAAVCVAAFGLLSFCVARSLTDGLDDRVRQVFRPDDIWSTNQLIFGNVVDGLEPPIAVAILAVVASVAAVVRRSPAPLVFAGAITVVAAALTMASKALVGRADPHGDLNGHGGAYPSGHMVMLVVALSGCVLLLRRRSHWGDWVLVTAVVVTMGVSLLFLATHWFTDVVGGALLGAVVATVATLVPAPRGLRREGPEQPASAPDVPVHVEDDA
ncbi:phosphatase PAP2 family protein [Nocardioides guangzhouensis]|uniref:Phosphatase PAP2 family protein n=1 Tax=Nocardioides guangzhouensis TaxID=2497878 RepID=A0A4Q4ZC78_9ACTN|nr:phosphatase PAP2 family protein [Nocardioides guangzhouensis]RYP85562.1 phosphatase PAP2 family protein [Nocardioides guangzhouensis]